ncbi:unnamed protein product [Polarella glacialis]|uniref:Uncharacterized protein n=1 Tax=Polarella glacialis TaxID=89957 RepID=A0A813HHR1_POLGL|nr:unnamed protein product [Polarella glacialis]
MDRLLSKPPAPPMTMILMLEFLLGLSARHSLAHIEFFVDLRTKNSSYPSQNNHFPDTNDGVPTRVIVQVGPFFRDSTNRKPSATSGIPTYPVGGFGSQRVCLHCHSLNAQIWRSNGFCVCVFPFGACKSDWCVW